MQKNLPHFVQVSARVIWRIGGKSKKQAPVVKYVEIEKPVEVEKIVERIVEKQADTAGSVEAMACDLLDNIYFEFDKDVLTAASETTLDVYYLRYRDINNKCDKILTFKPSAPVIEALSAKIS